MAEDSDALKDYKLVIEYQHLKQMAPGGVYVIPAFDDNRTWFGVIFVRRGLYSKGIFKFTVKLPPEYNDVNTWPRVTFTSAVPFNPLVDAKTGELDIKAGFPVWDPAKNYMVNALVFVKKIFYMKDFDLASPVNPEAQRLFRTDKQGFLKEVGECVRVSRDRVYHNEEGASLNFSEPKAAHEQLRECIMKRTSEPGPAV